ncbi:hypothetical protein ACQ7DA_04550 [Zafaria sp. J156]|uniref:hypothetical protein n=1 Tax=Zafaria sp. J156 TaxID=3116490 RepID=UPI002E795C95|nr:hypothetical protein [Zafaria sp. J156]MEE1620496.1 hypothetical protein [Zafaria sp. J156]
MSAGPAGVEPLYAPTGPGVDPAGFGLLERIHRRGGPGLLDRVRRRRELLALHEAGLIDGRSRLRASGARYLDNVGAGPAWTVTGRYLDSHSTLSLWFGDGGATVLAGPSAEELRPGAVPGIADDAMQRLDLVRSSEAPSTVCAWAGVRPVAPLLAGPAALPLDEFEARAAGRHDGPGPEGLGALWEAPWFVWDVATSDGAMLGFINAGRAGHCAFGVADDGSRGAEVRLAPIDSGRVWRLLAGLVRSGSET